MATFCVAFFCLPIISQASSSSGIFTQYHTQEEIRKYIEKQGADIEDEVTYTKNPVTTAPYDPGKLSDATKQSALKMLNQIRYIAGLQEVSLSDGLEAQQQAAALLANIEFSHTPDKPADMDEDLYALGYRGTSSSNLAYGYQTLNYSMIYGLMADADLSNRECIGHRRWMLNPKMGRTAFGAVGKTYTLYAFDESSGSSVNGVVWPARQMPVEYFDPSYPWSFSRNTPIPSSATVKVVRKRDGRTWNFSSGSSDGYFYINNEYYGQPGCIIFHPEGASCTMGEVYEVTINGIGDTVRYSVEFFSLGKTGCYTVAYDEWSDPYYFPTTYVKKGQSMQISFSYPGSFPKTFLGWSLTPNATTAQYQPGESFTPVKDTVLYPVWRNPSSLEGANPISRTFKIDGYSSLFFSFSPSVDCSYTIESAGDIDPCLYVLDENGNEITRDDDSGDAYNFKTTLDCYAGRTYYLKIYSYSAGNNSCTLKITMRTFNVTLNANGGTLSTKSLSVGMNTPYGKIPSPSRSGYKFTGWFTAAKGGTRISSDSICSKNITLYAHWEKIIIPVISSVTQELNSVMVSWEPETAASFYRVFYKKPGGSWTKYKDVKETNCKVTGLITNTKYYFTVRCLGEDGSTYTSDYDKDGKGITYKATPQIKSLVQSGNAINVTWSSVKGADIYRVYYRTGDGSWKKYKDVSGTTCEVTGIPTGYEYSFTIRGIASDGVSYTTTYDQTGKSISYKVTPVIKSVSRVNNSVKVSWEGVYGTKLYRVFYKTEGGSWKVFGDVTGTSCYVSGLSTNLQYYFTVRCLNNDGTAYTSNYDKEGKGLVFKAIPEITDFSVDGGNVKIKWEKVKGAERYRLFIKSENGSWTKVGDTKANALTVSGLADKKSYTFTVRCVSSDGKAYTSDYDKAGKTITVNFEEWTPIYK